MANNTTMVKFQKGLKSAYEQAYITDETMTFYYLTDTRELYLGNIKISNKADLDAAIKRIAQNESDIQALYTGVEQMFTSMGEQLYAAETEEQSIRYIVANEYTNAIEADIGDMDSVSTTNKTVAGAINELKAAIGTGGTAAVVTLTESTTDTDYAKVYTLKQGETTIGNINIPKDMVVKTGAVEVNPEGQAEGTYIVLTLANATEDKIYVNVGTLVDIYKAAGNANQVQVAIDSTTREISATIVAGSITDVELASNAVITDKIADANVTKAKLSTTVQASLDKADTAMQQSDLDTLKTTLQGEIATAKQAAIDTAADDAQDKADDALAVAKGYADDKLAEAKSYADTKAGEGLKTSDFTTGETNGTFKVKDTEVAIKGLGTAAYADADDFDAAGSASTAESNAKTYTNTQISTLRTEMNTSVTEALTWGEIELNLA